MVHNCHRLRRIGWEKKAKNTTEQATIFLLVLANKYFSIFLKMLNICLSEASFVKKTLDLKDLGKIVHEHFLLCHGHNFNNNC